MPSIYSVPLVATPVTAEETGTYCYCPCGYVMVIRDIDWVVVPTGDYEVLAIKETVNDLQWWATYTQAAGGSPFETGHWTGRQVFTPGSGIYVYAPVTEATWFVRISGYFLEGPAGPAPAGEPCDG